MVIAISLPFTGFSDEQKVPNFPRRHFTFIFQWAYCDYYEWKAIVAKHHCPCSCRKSIKLMGPMNEYELHNIHHTATGITSASNKLSQSSFECFRLIRQDWKLLRSLSLIRSLSLALWMDPNGAFQSLDVPWPYIYIYIIQECLSVGARCQSPFNSFDKRINIYSFIKYSLNKYRIGWGSRASRICIKCPLE